MPQFNLNRNAQANGDHEVHASGCVFTPALSNQIDLGYHPQCSNAVAEAKRRYPNNRINGCYYCSNPCHTS